jgi:multidrug efflux pump subunit AcrB
VWGTPELRSSLTGVQNLLVDRPDGGGQVRVGDVAQVRVAPTPAVIQRDASSRYLDVTATINGRSPAEVTDEVRDGLRGVQFPFEHRAEIVGDTAQNQDTLIRILGVAIVALVLAYLLLQAALRSWGLALIVAASVPVALAGGLIAAAIGGGIVSLGTLIGLLALAAISLKQSLSLGERVQELKAAEPTNEPARVLREATRDALAPVVTTALAGAGLVLPMVIAGPSAGLELLHPMAVAVLGGLVTLTLVNLFVVPGLYAARPWRQHTDMHTTPVHRTDEELVTSGSMA